MNIYCFLLFLANNDKTIQELQKELRQLRNVLGTGSTSSRSFETTTSSALGNLSRLQTGLRYNPSSRNNTAYYSTRKQKKQASGRRYDIELVVLDYITGNPVKHPFQDHKIIGTAALVLFSNFDEKVCEREIQSIIRSLEGLATHDGKFYMVKRIGRHTIERPALSHLHKFDGRAINSFKGNGKLYIRLASPSGISSPSPSSDEDEEEEDYNEIQTEQEQQQDNDHDDYYDKNDGNDNDDIEMTYISRPRQRPMQVTIDETHSTPPSPTSQEQLDYEVFYSLWCFLLYYFLFLDILKFHFLV